MDTTQQAAPPPPDDLTGLVRAFAAPPPVNGLQEGLDAALPDPVYKPTFAPTLENIRVGLGTWETRFGMTAGRVMPGAGNVRYIGSVYNSAGSRFRLAARGGTLYDWDEGDGGAADASYQAVAGGTGLADNLLQGTQLGDYFYFTDRGAGSPLRKYLAAAASSVAAVAKVAAPAAPGVKARTYGVLEDWTGAAPFGWTQSSVADFDVIDGTATDPWPGNGQTAKIRARTTSAINKTISKDVAAQALNSHNIAFYFKHGLNALKLTFEIGINAAGESTFKLIPPKSNTWYVFFCPVGDIGTINFKRWKCLNSDTPFNVFIGNMLLPGKLEGQYRYRVSFYNPTTTQETALSPASAILDCSTIGVNYHNESDKALKKSGQVTFATGGGASGFTQVRIYRSGGVASLTKDAGTGQDIWIQVGVVSDLQTTLGGGPYAIGTTAWTVASSAGINVNDWVVINRGQTSEDFLQVTAIPDGTHVTTQASVNAHVATETLQVAYLDNVANEEVDPTQRIFPERDDPPTGIQWIDRSPDGRLWLFGWDAQPNGVAVSNHPTPFRKVDYEIFPDGVDPLTRQDLLQGWRFNVGGLGGQEQIVWGGFVNQIPTVLTRTGLWQINAYNQTNWGPETVVKRVDQLGCIAGETVKMCGGSLYWVTDGPRVVRWDGQGAPEVISMPSTNVRLQNAPAANWSQWFAHHHAKRDGAYYCLWIVPQGQTTPSMLLEFNADGGYWEPVVYYDGAGTPRWWAAAEVQRGSKDQKQLFAADNTGQLYLLDDPTALTDAGQPIRVTFSTKKFRLGPLSKIERFRLILPAAAADSITVTVTASGSEYGTVSHSYVLPITGAGDVELRQRCHFDLMGRFVQFAFSGQFTQRPQPRTLEWTAIPYRDTQVSST